MRWIPGNLERDCKKRSQRCALLSLSRALSSPFSILSPLLAPSLTPLSQFRSRFQFITATFVTAMLSNSSSQVGGGDGTLARGGEERSSGKQRKRTARDEKERTFGKRRGAKRSNEKQEYLKETETENRRRGRERQFLRKVVGRDGARAFFGRALLQFCAMQVWRWVQHSSHQLLAALTAYAVFQFQLNWNFSLSLFLSESQVDFQVDSERERRRSRRRCRRRTIRVHVNGVSLSSSSSTSSSSPFARWEDLFVNTARRVADRALRDAEVGMLAQRAGGGGGRERERRLSPSEGVT